MRVHHLNAATLCPVGGRCLIGNGEGLLRGAKLVCHCLLIESPAGLVLVDTGLGLEALQAAAHGPVRGQMRRMGARLDPEETLVRQLERKGLRREDVRHIILTHLDLDHAGGLGDFPHATVHVYAREHGCATAPGTLHERMRYFPVQWAHGPRWARYEPQGEPWFGFECVRQLEGLPPELLLVPLVGHTRGHCAVAVRTGSRWLLHAGDAYFFHGEVHGSPPHCPPGLSLMQRLFEAQRRERLHNQERLRELVRQHSSQVEVFCAHDPGEWERLAHTPEAPPARVA